MSCESPPVVGRNRNKEYTILLKIYITPKRSRHMTDPEEPEAFADVTEAVGDDWEAETTPYERVR